MSKIQFSTKNLSSNRSALYEVEKFNGVDYTSTPTEVDDTRAIEISNYMPYGRGLVKRPGYERINYTANGVSTPFVECLHMTKFKDYIVIFRANGNLDFYNDNFELVKTVVPIASINPTLDPLENHKIMSFSSGNRLFFFLGNHYCFYDEDYNPYDVPCYFDVSGWGNKSFTSYIPLVLSNVPSITSEGKALTLESPNLLQDYVRVKLAICVKRTDAVVNVPSNELAVGASEGLTEEMVFDVASHLGLQASDTEELFFNNNGTQNNLFNGEIFTENNVENITSLTTVTNEYETNKYLYWQCYNQKILKITITKPDGSKEYKTADFNIYAYRHDYEGYKANKIEIRIWDEALRNVEANSIITGELTLLIKAFNNNDIYGSIINKAENFIFFNNFEKDNTLFVSVGNKDFHTIEPKFDYTGKEWTKFTYFGADNYQVFGDSNGSIVDYGLLNNGTMVILKREPDDGSSIYIRRNEFRNQTVNYSIDTPSGTVDYTYVKSEELFPVSLYGLTLPIDEHTKAIQYDNKTIISNKSGIYYVNVEASTATQTYMAYELSYMIRENLGNDLSINELVVYEGNLYVARKDKNGKLRIYVADKDRYTFIDGKMQYEWWVLDDFDDILGFYTVNDKLYFADAQKLYVFNKDKYYDEILRKINTSLAVTKKTTSEYAVPDLDVYTYSNELGNKNKNDIVYTELPINFNIVSFFSVEVLDYDGENTFDYNMGQAHLAIKKVRFTPREDVTDDFAYNFFLCNETAPSTSTAFGGGTVMPFQTEYVEGERVKFIAYMCSYDAILLQRRSVNPTAITDVKFQNNMQLGKFWATDNQNSHSMMVTFQLSEALIDKVYSITYDEYGLETERIELDDCFQNEAGEYKLITDPERTITNFDYFTLKLYETPLQGRRYFGGWFDTNLTPTIIESPQGYYRIYKYTDIIKKVFTKRPVKSKWFSKYTDLGAINTLKTTSNIYFVPETRLGGITSMAYRTARREKDFSRKNVYIEKVKQNDIDDISDTQIGLDFGEVDFVDFHFETQEFAHSFSCRKKVKNFAFIQFKFYSNLPKNSTIVRFVIKYAQTRNNRGMK